MSPTLVIQTAFLGDVILTLPLIQQLAYRFGPVDVVVTPAAAPLLTGQPSIGRVISYDKRGHDSGVAGFRRLAGTLSAEGYARAFLPHRSLRSALLARMAGIPERVGFAGGIAGTLHTHRIARPTAGHETSRLLSLVGESSAPIAPWFEISPADAEWAGSWLASHRIHDDYVLLAPGAAWGTKRWPYFAELAAVLSQSIVVIGGREDRATAESIVQAAPARTSLAAGETSLTQTAALVARATLVVSNDSFALHLAGALSRPVIAVVGPTGPAPGFEPSAPLGKVVAHPALACRPCSLHGHRRCPLGHHRCMRELSAERVAEAVQANFERNAERAQQ